LAKDPKLANESWDRFLPQFRKRHLKTSEKTAKKNERIEALVEARNEAGIPTTKEELQRREAGADGKEKKQKKKIYTPFPPAQQPRKMDLQLETGEYFLKTTEKEKREEERKRKKVVFCFCFDALPDSSFYDVFSKQKQWRRGAKKEQKSLSHLQRKLHLPLKKNGRKRGQRRTLKMMKMTNQRRRKGRKGERRETTKIDSIMLHSLSYRFLLTLFYSLCTRRVPTTPHRPPVPSISVAFSQSPRIYCT
jgi:hypothetical protein